MIRGILFLAPLVVALAASAAEAQTKGEQTPQSFEKQVTKTYSARYLLYLPRELGKDPSQKWPLILFLHGAGERGDDLEKVKTHGPPKLVAAGKELPFIIVSPQCSADQWWDVDTLNALLDDVMARYPVDPDRVYLTGLSMGGFGTWSLATAHPERFAAIAPICGGGDPFMARRLKDVPAWVFHGEKDPVVPVKLAHDMVDALKAAGGDVKLTIYPDAQHDSWTQTYDNKELYAWFLSHTRAAAHKPADPKG